MQVANVCSYKLGLKMNFNFRLVLNGQSHIVYCIDASYEDGHGARGSP